MTAVVIGAGPAGLTAAYLLAAGGMETALVDEWSEIGNSLGLGYRLDAVPALQDLTDRLRRTTATVLTDTVAWAAFSRDDGYEVMLNSKGRASSMVAAHLVLATGTTNRVRPFSGGTLPGVITEGAFRRLIHQHRVLPGDNIVVIGGAGSSQLAADLRRWALGVRTINVSARMVASIDGDTAVRGVTLADGTHLTCDCVVLALGDVPDVQLAGMLGVPTVLRSEAGGWFVPGPDPLPNLQVCGGALLGAAPLDAVIGSAERAASAILGNPITLTDALAGEYAQ